MAELIFISSLCLFCKTIPSVIVLQKRQKSSSCGAKAKAPENREWKLMFYMDIRHNVKKANSSKNAFHYLTRTGHFLAKKQDEELEFVRSGHLPAWAKNRPADFWKSADQHEIERGRTSTVLTVALPKELNRLQRIELVESFIQEFTDTYQFPYTAAVHHHASALTGEDQPHLHLMYSERSLVDGIERSPEQFFKQYRPKNPQQGGAQKMTANALGQGKNQVVIFRQTTEQLLNDCLQKYAPQKNIMLNGLALTVENSVSCLSNRDYNKQFGTDLKDVPQIPRWKLYSADPIIQLDVQAQKETIQRIREENKMELYKTTYENELAKRELEQIKPLQQRYADRKKYTDFELNELQRTIVKACQGASYHESFLKMHQQNCMIMNRLLERSAFGSVWLELQKQALMKDLSCEQLIVPGATFIQINLQDAEPSVWDKLDQYCSNEDDQAYLHHFLRHLSQFIQKLANFDDTRSQAFDTNFSYQFYPWQRNDIQRNFEVKQVEMRGFMQLYQGFIAPLASRYFTEDYELDQQHNLKKFKERDDLIIEALNTHLEPQILDAVEVNQLNKNESSHDWNGPGF